MNVLSLFDGMSCGQLALQRAGIQYDTYYASEIDKHATKVTMANFPNTIQLGDVVGVRGCDLPKIDLLIGGSPCQGFSFAGAGLNFNDPRSKLFFEYVRILKEVQPRYFLLENVPMLKEYEDVISEIIGVQPRQIDSVLVSAQSRKRLYWTNIPELSMPVDRCIYVKDIIHEYKPGYDHVQLDRYKIPKHRAELILENSVKLGHVDRFNVDGDVVYSVNGNDVILGKKLGDYAIPTADPTFYVKKQNASRFKKNGKFHTMTAFNPHGVLVSGYIRKLTPIECERLQTVPDNYTSCVSDTQRYMMLGNGWTVDVIAHIFKGML
jgi:DNA (cytosine-5)-methyltransferase 3A